jgi:type VI secretion system protein VasI
LFLTNKWVEVMDDSANKKKSIKIKILIGLVVTVFLMVKYGESKVSEAVKKAEAAKPIDKTASSAENQEEGTKIGNWLVGKGKSDFDDSESVNAYTYATTDITGWPNKVYRPYLALRCFEKKTQVLLATGMVAAGDGTVVRARLDADKPFMEAWGNTTNHEGFFKERGEIAFIKKLSNYKKMLIEFAPFNTGNVTATFELDGINEVIPILQKACNWGGSSKSSGK